MTNDQRFRDLLTRLHAEVFKPRGWKKEGQNFRLFLPDGLGRIVNFQKSAYNDAEVLSFYINLGIYWEPQPEITNRKFKEYDCRIRGRVHGTGEKWNIFEGRDMEKLFLELKTLFEGQAMDRFDRLPSRKRAVMQYGAAGKHIILL